MAIDEETETLPEVRCALDLWQQLLAVAPGMRAREGQREMVAAVARAIAAHSPLVVEAGTGTGKTLGYLIPCLALGKRVIVVTATLALQHQLIEKDLPLVASLLDRDIRYGTLKGRAHYLCAAKVDELDASLGEYRLFRPAEDEALVDFVRWAKKHPMGEDSDLADHPGFHRFWPSASATAVDCPGVAHCRMGQVCAYEAKREEASGYDVLVVNAALFAVHALGRRKILPPSDVVIFDECHRLERALCEATRVTFNRRHLEELAQAIDEAGVLSIKGTGLRKAGAMLEEAVVRAFEADSRQSFVPYDAAIHAEVGQAMAEAMRCAQIARTHLKTAITQAKNAGEPRRADRASRALTMVGQLLDEPWVGDPFVALERATASLVVVETDASALLHAGLNNGDESSVAIFASATIPDGFERRLGIPKSERMRVSSPYELGSQMLLYVPENSDPVSSRDCWLTEVADELVELVKTAGGRTLALFTSHDALRLAAERLRGAVTTPVLVQGELPNETLLQQFRDDEQASLLGSRAYFQGVDVPGPSLSVVVLDRLPFAPMGDILSLAWSLRADEAKRAGKGPGAFVEVALPEAAIALAQAAGRLIRSETDRGVFALLDPRSVEQGYSSRLWKHLNGPRITRHMPEVRKFLSSSINRPQTHPLLDVQD